MSCAVNEVWMNANVVAHILHCLGMLTSNVDTTTPIPSHVEHRCSQSKCTVVLPDGYKYKICQMCHDISKHSAQKKQKRNTNDTPNEEGSIKYILISSDTESTSGDNKVSAI